MANPYDVNVVFAELEQELIKSFKRNMSKYTDTSDMWQAMKMKDLEMYRREIAQEITSATKRAKRLSKIVLRDDFLKGADKVDAFMKQFKLDVKTTSKNDFFKLNRRKLNAMLEGVYGDLDKASQAIYRKMDDVYRQTLFKAQIAKDSGVYTTEQAVDVATKDFLEKGINCIKYKNGALVNVASYAEMAIRTASKKAMMTAEGARNQEWGVSTIQITQHGSTCELCSPWQGRVLIDDVYSGGKRSDGPYPLLSEAMAAGLFHPNCRHGSTTFFEGISEEPPLMDSAEVEAKYEKEQQQRYNERKIREWKRKANGSMDEGNRRKAEAKVREWQAKQRQLLDENDWLRRKYDREGTKGIGLEKKLPPEAPKKYTLADCTREVKDMPKPSGSNLRNETFKARVFTTPDGTNFVFKSGMDRSQQMMRPEQAIELWQKVPENIRKKAPKTIEFVDYYNPQDSYWKKKYKNFNHSYATGGGDEITFYRYDHDHDPDYVVRTFCHESGHHIDQKMAENGVRFANTPKWTEAMAKDKVLSNLDSPTTYGANAPAEDFAESIAEYVSDKDKFTKLFPNRAKIVEDILK